MKKKVRDSGREREGKKRREERGKERRGSSQTSLASSSKRSSVRSTSSAGSSRTTSSKASCGMWASVSSKASSAGSCKIHTLTNCHTSLALLSPFSPIPCLLPHLLPPLLPSLPLSFLPSPPAHTVFVIMNARDRMRSAGGTFWLSERSSQERSCLTISGRLSPSTFIPRTRLASTNSSRFNASSPSFCINCKRVGRRNR